MPKSASASSNQPQDRQALIAKATVGDASAQSTMGDRCRTGDAATEPDLPDALKWYRLAAAHGDRNAQNNIGAMYQNAMGVAKDLAEAAKWYRLAADQGLAIAQYNLALMLGWGKGVPMDEPGALIYLHDAAN